MDPLPLLCPLTDFPYMLPECVPVAPLLIVTAALPLVAAIVLLRRHLRMRDGKFLGQVQLCGVVRLRDGPSLHLRTSGGEVLVSAADAVLRGRPLVTGRRVAVTGIHGLVAVPGEQLFRQPARAGGIDAIEIRATRWDFLGWLLPTLAIAAWLAFATALLVMTHPSDLIGALPR